MKKPKVIDLFAGCGGLSYGFLKSGYDVVLGIDNWKDSLITFAANHPGAKTFEADLSSLDPHAITNKFGIKPKDVDVVIGGPPCQGFSISGKRMIDDPRNKLYKSFVEVVGYLKPKAFLMENVPNLVSMDNGSIKDQVIEDFENLGYSVVYKVLKASDYGVPQNRRRVIFVGLLSKKKFTYPESTHGEEALQKPRITAKEAIGDLPDESLNDGAPYKIKPQSAFQEYARKDSTGIYNHENTNHSEQTKRIISLVPDGGNYKDLPENLHQTRKVHIAWTRLNSSKPSFTIDTGHRHHFHYAFNRIPTVRESARIQSFPDNFIFKGSKTSQYKQVGNAVPPLMATALAQQMLKYL